MIFLAGNFTARESVNETEGFAHALVAVVKILSTANFSFIQRFCLACKLILLSFCLP